MEQNETKGVQILELYVLRSKLRPFRNLQSLYIYISMYLTKQGSDRFVLLCHNDSQTHEGTTEDDIGLENRVLDLASHSLSDRRWGVIIAQPMRHLLSQMFQQHINSATQTNSHSTDVTMLG